MNRSKVCTNCFGSGLTQSRTAATLGYYDEEKCLYCDGRGFQQERDAKGRYLPTKKVTL